MATIVSFAKSLVMSRASKRMFPNNGETRSLGFQSPCLAHHVDLYGTSGAYRYGIGLGPGVGATPQMTDAQGGRGGVGMRKSLPCVAAVPPDMH